MVWSSSKIAWPACDGNCTYPESHVYLLLSCVFVYGLTPQQWKNSTVLFSSTWWCRFTPAGNQSFFLVMCVQASLVRYFFSSLEFYFYQRQSDAVILVRNLSCMSRNTWLCWEAGCNDLVISSRVGSGSTVAQQSASGSFAQPESQLGWVARWTSAHRRTSVLVCSGSHIPPVHPSSFFPAPNWPVCLWMRRNNWWG